MRGYLRLVAAGVLISSAAACSGDSASRANQLPPSPSSSAVDEDAATTACPVSTIAPTPSEVGFGPWAFTTPTAVGLAAAPDPSSGISLGYQGSGPAGEWAVKALWFATPGFDEAVTISGKRVDRTGPTGPPPRFEQGSERVEQLEIPPGWSANVDHGHHTYPSAVVVSEAGCYELTISSTAFTTTIVIQVELADE
jgi:hypothetical protein